MIPLIPVMLAQASIQRVLRWTLACASVTVLGMAPASALECETAGCSGQLCVVKGTGGNVVSTCEWRDSYACFQKLGRCEAVAGPDGKPACGWRPTTALQVCLEETGGFEAGGGAVRRNIQQ